MWARLLWGLRSAVVCGYCAFGPESITRTTNIQQELKLCTLPKARSPALPESQTHNSYPRRQGTFGPFVALLSQQPKEQNVQSASGKYISRAVLLASAWCMLLRGKSANPDKYRNYLKLEFGRGTTPCRTITAKHCHSRVSDHSFSPLDRRCQRS